MRWGDMDAQGHVNNAAFLDYLQEARVDFLLTGPEALHRLLDTGVLVVSHQVEYLHPVQVTGQPLRVELWVDSLGASRFFISYTLFDGDQLVARARTGAAPFDLATSTLRRLHADERSALQSARMDRQPLRPLPRPGSDGGHHFALRVRWSDIDSYAHVNNVKYYDYIQEARIALMSEALEWTAEDMWVLVRQDLDYLRPLDFRIEPYQVRTVVAAIGNRSITLAADITDPASGARYASAGTVVVKSRPLTPADRTRLAAWESRAGRAGTLLR